MGVLIEMIVINVSLMNCNYLEISVKSNFMVKNQTII